MGLRKGKDETGEDGTVDRGTRVQLFLSKGLRHGTELWNAAR